MAPAIADAKTRLLSLWRSDLRHHFDEEDADLDGLLVGSGAPLQERLRSDHARLREAFESLQGRPDQEWLAVTADLHDHIRWEEDVLFEWLQNELSEEALQGLWQRSRVFRLEHRGPASVQEASPRAGRDASS